MSGRNSVRALLGLGGNIGDPRAAMGSALRTLDAGPDTTVAAVSSLYRTPPWGKTDQPDFLNAVAAVETALTPRALMRRCLDIERSLRRDRRERWGPRPIDIDILTYGDLEIAEEKLTIPHPRMFQRAFVLVPLVEIAPDLAIGGNPVAKRLAGLDPSGIVPLYSGSDWWKDET